MTISRMLIVGIIGLALAGLGAFLLTTYTIDDARAQGVSEVRDAGLDVDAGLRVPDPVTEPAESIGEVKRMWNLGVFQGVVLAILIIAAAVHRRTEPEDRDGDGKPDVDHGWRGKTWSITGAVLMIGVPLLSVVTGVAGASWNAVGIGVVAGIGLLASNLNPKKGSKAPIAAAT